MRKHHNIQIFAAVGLLLAAANCSIHGQTLSGLQLWLKADAISNVPPMGKVSFWTNSVGTGSDATNSNVATQPVLVPAAVAGQPAVRFSDDGSNVAGNTNLNWLVSPLSLSANSNSFTAVALFQSQVVGQRDYILHQVAPGYPIMYVEGNAAPGTNIVVGASGSTVTNAFEYVPGTWVIATVVQDAAAGTISLYQNGALVGTNAIGTDATPATSGWVIGSRANLATHGLAGDISEILVYDSALSVLDRSATESYLAQKYGFTILTDSFNTADTADLSVDLGARQTGVAATADWIKNTWANSGGGGNTVGITNGALTLSVTDVPGFGDVLAAPAKNFVTYEGENSFTIRYTCTVTNDDFANSWWASWVSCSIGSVPGEPFFNNPNSSFAVFLINKPLLTNGVYSAFVGGQQVVGYADLNPLSGPDQDGPPTGPEFDVTINVVSNIYTFSVDGFTYGTWTNNTCRGANYITFMLGTSTGNFLTTATAWVDDLAIFTVPNAGDEASSGPTPLPATPVVADPFTTADTSNVNDNGVTRQTGPAAPIVYDTSNTTNGAVGITNNSLVMAADPFAGPGLESFVEAAPTFNFGPSEVSDSFQIKFKVAPTNSIAFGGQDSWAGIRFRGSAPSQFVADTNTGMGLILRDTGNFQLFDAGVSVATGFVPGAPVYDVDIRVQQNVLTMAVNGELLVLNPCSVGYEYTLPASTGANYISLQAAAGNAVYTPDSSVTWDDFEFNALSPVGAPTLVNPLFSAAPTPAFSFSWDSAASVSYKVDCTTSLSSPVWTEVGTVVGTGGLVSFTNTPASSDAAYYRVRIAP